MLDIDVMLLRFGLITLAFATACAGPTARTRGRTLAVMTGPQRGHLSALSARRVVEASHDKVQACYHLALKHDDRLRGRVATKFVIGIDGKVTSAHQQLNPVEFDDARAGEPNITDPEMVECVLDALRELSFPAPVTGEFIMRFPFFFDKLRPEQVRAEIVRNRARFQACYHAALQRDRWLRGQITTKLSIGESGAVTSATHALEPSRETPDDSEGHPTSISDSKMIGCVLSVLLRLRFPFPGREPLTI
jgi:hypothetical protein